MNVVVLAAFLEVAAIGVNQGGFEEAYRESLATERPLVVLIGAVWCPGCQQMKNSVLPQVAKEGGLDKVVFFYVDFDEQRQLATRLKRGDSIPQLIRFDRTPAGDWHYKCLIGARKPREVHHFINVGLPRNIEADEAPVTAEVEKRSQEPVSDSTTSAAVGSSAATSASGDVPTGDGKEGRSAAVDGEAESPSVPRAEALSSYWMMSLDRLLPRYRERSVSVTRHQTPAIRMR